ncbi:hypothetical protein HY487_01205 [Candidatus Woesearchaeota archaeon]|nr:hypothetical protein [Candidatus Woesearchaeota archaeon]
MKAIFSFLIIFAVLLSGISHADTEFGEADDVSIDRVKVNGKTVSESRANFLDEADEFDVTIDLTATEQISNMHVESILTDAGTGSTISDSTGTFSLKTNQSTLVALNLQLISVLKKQADFRLAVRVVDADGDIEEKNYGLKLSGARGGAKEELDVSIDSVEIEGNALAENENNFAVVDKGEKRLDLKVRLTALENVEDAHIDAILAFENGDVVADATATFDIADGDNAARDLELKLPFKFEQSNFKLRVNVIDAEGDSEQKLYGLKISQKKFPFVISSILLPENGAEAGKAVLARVSFRNSGVAPLEGIIVKASIPELGISSTRFVDQIKDSEDSAFEDEFILKIPEGAGTGTYTLRAELASQFGNDNEIREIPFFIFGKSGQKSQIVNEKLVINVPISRQDIKNDGSEVIYPLILTNEGPDANTYTLLLDGADWAKLRLSDSNVFVINPKGSKTVNIFASTRTKATGEQIFLATVKANGEVLKQVPLKGNVVETKGLLAAKLKILLEIILISVVIAIASIGFFFGARKFLQSGDEEIPDEAEGEAYY